MNSPPLISIIINNFNYAQFLGVAIDSALNQTYPNTEILIIDDGSTDNSRQIIESYADKVKSVFKSNGGQASAFNAGVKSANGKIVIFLDSDDVLASHCLEHVSEFFMRDSELVCVRWYLEHIDQNGTILGSTNPPQGAPIPVGYMKNEILKNGWRFNTPPTSGNAFLKSCLDQFFPIPEEMTRCADVFLFANTAVRGKIEMNHAVMGCYRQNLANTSHHLFSGAKVLSEILAADITDQSLLDYFKDNPITDKSIRDQWATVGDEVLRKILFKYADIRIFSEKMFYPMSIGRFFRSHSPIRNIKYLIGSIFVKMAPSEGAAFWGAGFLLGKHDIWGAKKFN